jgi:signal recognition particle subunit SRP54
LITGKTVKFLGMGEKLDALEEFRPEGMAQRILGMGDIVGLVTEAMTKFDQEKIAEQQAKLEKGQFTLDDFMAQMGQVQKLGDMRRVMEMIPGMKAMMGQVNVGDVEGSMGRMRAIYNSMTKKERTNIGLLDGPRRRRVARGAGVEVNEVGQFVKQFEQTRDMMKAVGGMGMMGRMKLMRHLASGNLAGLGMPGGPQLRVKKTGHMEKKDRNKKKKRR